MPELKLGELAEATGGTLVRGNADRVVDNFVIERHRLRQAEGFGFMTRASAGQTVTQSRHPGHFSVSIWG